MPYRRDLRSSLSSLLAVLSLLILLSPRVHADDFSAALDRTRVRANETLTLRLSASGKLAGEPDLAPLTKDFEVLNQSSGTRMSIVNGVVSQGRDWTLELAPRRTGRLTIPALALGAQQTKPLEVEVVPADQADPGGGPRPVFVDTVVDAASPYVQQPFGYRVRVLYREQPRRAVLSEPEVEGATLERQGEDQSYTEEIDGQRYTVIERRFLVVPQRSGPLTIRGPRLEALMPEVRPGARRSPFGDFDSLFGGSPFQGLPDLVDPGSGRRVIERGPDRTLEVRPQPDGQDGGWLPAESVQISDEWTPSPPRFRVGEPVTRTLVITALGTAAAQLPTLDPGAPEGARVYPEPPKLEDLPGTTPTALKTLKLALVPTRAGTLTLPEIRLPWWDTTADQARVAVIPQRTVQVEPALGETSPPDPAPATAAGPPLTAPGAAPGASGPTTGPDETLATPVAPTGDAQTPGPEADGPWPWLTLGFGLAWLGTLVWALRLRRRGGSDRPAAAGASDPRGQSLRALRNRVRNACLAGNAGSARTALLDWGRARWPARPPGGLGDFGARLGTAGSTLAPVLAQLDRALYAPVGTTWDGAETWRRLEPFLVTQDQAARISAMDPLPDLYPRLGDS